MMEKKGDYFNLGETFRQAAEKFATLDPEEAAKNAGVLYDKERGAVTLKFIDTTYRVKHPEGEVTSLEGEAASIYTAIVILHYLNSATGTPLTGRWVAFRHLPGGDIYVKPFQGRAIVPFLKNFGPDPACFVKAAAALGGRKIEQSGVSMAIDVFARVPLCFTIWPGDDELPASATILFDEAAASYLPTEDYAHLPAIVMGALLDALKQA